MKLRSRSRALSLFVIGGLLGAIMLSPVVAAPNDPATKKFARKIANKKAKKKTNKLRNQLQPQINANAAAIAAAENQFVKKSDEQPKAYAYVHGDGSGVDEARAKGITDADVSHPVNGLYCFKLGFTPVHVQATVEWVGGASDTVIHAATAPNVGGTCGGTAFNLASARMVDASAGTTANVDFFIQFIG